MDSNTLDALKLCAVVLRDKYLRVGLNTWEDEALRCAKAAIRKETNLVLTTNGWTIPIENSSELFKRNFK